jgi:hypothetical protein
MSKFEFNTFIAFLALFPLQNLDTLFFVLDLSVFIFIPTRLACIHFYFTLNNSYVFLLVTPCLILQENEVINVCSISFTYKMRASSAVLTVSYLFSSYSVICLWLYSFLNCCLKEFIHILQNTTCYSCNYSEIAGKWCWSSLCI